MAMKSDLETLLSATGTNVLTWFESKNVLPRSETVTQFLDEQTWLSAVRLVSATDPIIHFCVNVVGDLIPDEVRVLDELLHVELARVCASNWMGARSSPAADVAIGLTAQLRSWVKERDQVGHLVHHVAIVTLPPGHPATSVHLRPEAISYIVMAGIDQHLTEERSDTYLRRLSRIRSALGITASELARLLRVSREAVRKWERGETIATERWPDIDRLLGAAEMLLQYFKPEHLPSVVRRPIPELDNTTPLEWLESRRVDELAVFYDRKFGYGSTA